LFRYGFEFGSGFGCGFSFGFGFGFGFGFVCSPLIPRFEKAALNLLAPKTKGSAKRTLSDEHFGDVEEELIFLCVKLNTNRY
jgi:hypothetical protein